MDQPYPIKLSKDPIIECIFEIRFQTDNNISASDILPGIIFSRLQADYPKTTSLPASQIPKSIRFQDPNLAYSPTFRMENDQFVIQVGENVCTISCQIPYVGWAKFKPKILNLTDLILNSGIITSIERFSLKYINLIESIENTHNLDLLDSTISIGPFNINKTGFNLRLEIANNDIINLVNIASSAKVVLQKNKTQLSGLLFDIDSILQLPVNYPIEEFKNNFSSRIDEVRENEKNIFFSFLLCSTVERYKPIFDEGLVQ